VLNGDVCEKISIFDRQVVCMLDVGYGTRYIHKFIKKFIINLFINLLNLFIRGSC